MLRDRSPYQVDFPCSPVDVWVILCQPRVSQDMLQFTFSLPPSPSLVIPHRILPLHPHHLVTLSPCHLFTRITSTPRHPIALIAFSPCHHVTLLPYHFIALVLALVLPCPCPCPCPHLNLILASYLDLFRLRIPLSIPFLGHCILPSLAPPFSRLLS